MPCCPPPERWVVRAQPWLGTLVEVALPPAEANDERFAAAFAAIAHVHRRMNAHDPASDLSRIARSAHRRAVVVDRQTAMVLRMAQALTESTRGRFDATVPGRRGSHGTLAALRFEPGRRVRTGAPTRIDLSGIAKGHAVDAAVDALRAVGARAGHVNAGGDLRVFGAETWLPVRVRLPQDPAQTLPLFHLRQAAVATSADYFREDPEGALLDPRRRRHRPYAGSFTVVAPTCALADALTKVVALQPWRTAAWLSRHRAHAFRFDREGRCATTCAASTPALRLHPAWAA